MSADLLREYIALERERASLEARIKDINARREQIADAVLSRWSEDGTTQQRVDGVTLYVRRSAYARVIDRDRVREVLEAEGLGTMLTPNTQTLSAWIREREQEGLPLPESFTGVVDVFERHQIGARGLRAS